jgi:hypothetical protein
MTLLELIKSDGFFSDMPASTAEASALVPGGGKDRSMLADQN